MSLISYKVDASNFTKPMINCINELKEDAIKRQNKYYIVWLLVSVLLMVFGGILVDATMYTLTGFVFVLLGIGSIACLCHTFDWYRVFHT